MLTWPKASGTARIANLKIEGSCGAIRVVGRSCRIQVIDQLRRETVIEKADRLDKMSPFTVMNRLKPASLMCAWKLRPEAKAASYRKVALGAGRRAASGHTKRQSSLAPLLRRVLFKAVGSCIPIDIHRRRELRAA